MLAILAVVTVGFVAIACGEGETTTTVAPTETTGEPTPPEGETTTTGAGTTEAGAMDIVDTAVAAGDFNILASLLTAAGLVDTLKGAGPFTVFAPSDEAFAKVPEEILDNLAADPQGALTDVLTYHVLPDRVMAADITDGFEATTVQGETVAFSVDGSAVMINGAKIVQTDIEASNGVIHVIDAVLIPGS